MTLSKDAIMNIAKGPLVCDTDWTKGPFARPLARFIALLARLLPSLIRPMHSNSWKTLRKELHILDVQYRIGRVHIGLESCNSPSSTPLMRTRPVSNESLHFPHLQLV